MTNIIRKQTQREINKIFQKQRRERSKKLVLTCAILLKRNNKRITSFAILELIQNCENCLKIASVKKYLKELREEDKLV